MCQAYIVVRARSNREALFCLDFKDFLLYDIAVQFEVLMTYFGDDIDKDQPQRLGFWQRLKNRIFPPAHNNQNLIDEYHDRLARCKEMDEVQPYELPKEIHGCVEKPDKTIHFDH